MTITTYSPNRARQLAEACGQDFGRLAFDGFGIMLSDQQLEAHEALGGPGPRRLPTDPKFYWLSGGQRSGKTVLAALEHADACLYKRGLDNTDRIYWRNYAFRTLAIAPSNELTLRLWSIGDEISKGAHEAQFDSRARLSRGGAFLKQFRAGKISIGQATWPAWTFKNGSIVDFRSSEGYAYRLEGGQWWFITWDEWASQPDREIHKIRTDVLLGRSRDHDAKIVPMAWPKEETEHHLIAVIRDVEAGRDLDSRVIYLEADKAYFTNREALALEERAKTKAQIERTIKGRPAGGASKEFKPYVVDNLVRPGLPVKALPEDGYAYLTTWDLGATTDSTVGTTFRIPILDGRRVVTPEFRARIVDIEELPGADDRTLPQITYAIMAKRMLYRNAMTAVDATGMGGVFAVRELRDMSPRPLEFKSRSNDRLWGNMRLAAITNAIDVLTWDYDPNEPGRPWGLIEAPRIIPLLDQLATFDRDAKAIPDDFVWSLIIGLWYIRRYWALGSGAHENRGFDIRAGAEQQIVTRRRRRVRDQRSRLIGGTVPGEGIVTGVRRIRPQ